MGGALRAAIFLALCVPLCVCGSGGLSEVYVSGGDFVFEAGKLDYNLLFGDRPSKVAVLVRSRGGDGLRSFRRGPNVTVSIDGSGAQRIVPGISRSVPIKKKSERSILKVIVKNGEEITYTFTLDFTNAKNAPFLKSILATDQNHKNLKVEFQPQLTQNFIYAKHNSHKLTLDLECENGTTYVNGVSRQAVVPRIADSADQLIVVECKGEDGSLKYFFGVVEEELIIPPPKSLAVVTSGDACKVSDEYGADFECAAQSSTASFMAVFDPAYQYRLRTPDESVMVRLVSGSECGAVPLSSSLYLEGVAGSMRNRWSVRVMGSYFTLGGDGRMRYISSLIACVILLSLVIVGTLMVFSRITGCPFVASEVPAMLLFLLQTFCFGDSLKAYPTVLSDIAMYCKYLTFFFPLSFSGEVNVQRLENCLGCLVFCATVMLVTLLVHACVRRHARSGGKNEEFVLPHYLAYGNWEIRILHLLLFPLSVAGVKLICHPLATTPHMCLGIGALAGLAALLVNNTSKVKRAVDKGRVFWLWNEPAEEIGTNSGFWTDTECDQLISEPSDRSLLGSNFAMRWTYTIGEIQKIKISKYQKSNHNTPVSRYSTSSTISTPTDHTNAKAPIQVVLKRTQKGGGPGHLVAGLFTTEWIDLLMTFANLKIIFKNSTHLSLPLTVKTHQLTGGLSGGYLEYYFSGARVPFARCGEGVYRWIVGIAMGVALGGGGIFLTNLVFVFLSITSFCGCGYVLRTGPLARTVENKMFALNFGLVGLGSLAFVGRAFGVTMSRWVCFPFLTCLCGAIFTLTVYTFLMSLCTIGGMFNSKTAEYRMLTSLCNTKVRVTDRARGTVLTETHGFNRLGTTSVLLTVNKYKVVRATIEETRPLLEIAATQFIQGVHTHQLTIPTASLSIDDHKDPLGYKIVNLTSTQDLGAQLAEFLNAHTPNLASILHKAAMEAIGRYSVSGKLVSIHVVDESGQSGENNFSAPTNCARHSLGQRSMSHISDPRISAAKNIQQNNNSVFSTSSSQNPTFQPWIPKTQNQQFKIYPDSALRG